MIVRTAVAQSYRNIARQICDVNGWNCRVVPRSSVWTAEIDMYVGSQYDVVYEYGLLAVHTPKLLYITVEGDFVYPGHWASLRELCKKTHCVVPARWGRALLEGRGVDVDGVVHHALPPGWESVRASPSYDVVYVNARYVFKNGMLGREASECERKGWRWWGDVCRRFRCVGFVSNCDGGVPGAFGYVAGEASDVYRLLALGKVYTSLTTHEGFGLNNVMALALGVKQVIWDIPVLRETVGDIPGVYTVPAESVASCYVDYSYGLAPGVMEFRYGDIEEYLDTVAKALNDSTRVDVGAVVERFSPTNYRAFSEFLKERT